MRENPRCSLSNRNPTNAKETDVLSHDYLSQTFASDDNDDTSSIYESVVGWDDDSTDSDEADDAEGTDMANAAAGNDTKKKIDHVQPELGYYTENMGNLRPKSYTKDMNPILQDRNLVYTQGDLVTSYIIKMGC